MKILGIIPARGGSKGVPRKNIKLLGGKPLIQYSIATAKESKLLDQIIVSSEDDEIIEVANSLGIKCPFKRPNYLATDESPTIDTVIHALKYFKSNGIEFDAVCLLQTTSPFRKKKFLDTAIEKFISKNTDSLISVLEVPHEYNPHWVFEKNNKGNLTISTGEAEIISRRQELPKSYFRDGAIYITKADVVLNHKSLYGNSISYIESSRENYVNIDTLIDWEKAENIINAKGFI